MYIVETSEEGQQNAFATRHQAILAAKQLSENTHRTVKVLNEGRYERLMYRRGELLEGIYITRDRRKQVGPLP